MKVKYDSILARSKEGFSDSAHGGDGGLAQGIKALQQLNFGELKFIVEICSLEKKPLDTQMNLMGKIRQHIEFLVKLEKAHKCIGD